MWRMFTLLVVLVWHVLPAEAARYALVIGNSKYTHVTALKNPKNDSELIEKALRQVGFEVTLLQDLDQRGMKQAITGFGRKLKLGAEAGLFYYAGHGVEVDGENYLVPIDADVQHRDEIDVQAVSVNSFLRTMETSGTSLNIIVLDACRNNPFRSMRATGGGLAHMQAPRGTFVAYATAPGSVAADGDGDNSPFTQSLAKNMVVAGLQLEEVFKQTRADVLGLSNNEQLPFDSSAITGNFYFVPAAKTAVVVPEKTLPGPLLEEPIVLNKVEPPKPVAAPDEKLNTKPQGWLGLNLAALNAETAEAMGIAKLEGALVVNVVDGTAGKAAGIERGDVIIQFGDKKIVAMSDLPRAVAATQPGDVVILKLVRKGNLRSLEVIIGPLGVDETAISTNKDQDSTSFTLLGMTLSRLNDELRNKQRIGDKVEGLLVLKVAKKSSAFEKNIKVGDVILEAGGKKLLTYSQFSLAVEAARKSGKSSVLLLTAVAGKSAETRFIALKLK